MAIKEWNFLRIFRLLLGVFLLIEASRDHQMLLYLMGAFLTLQAFLNVGCSSRGCANGHCATEPDEKKETSI